MAIRRALGLIQVGSLSLAEAKRTPLTEQTNQTRTMKARTEGEVAADPLGDLSPFTRRALLSFYPESPAFAFSAQDGKALSFFSG